MATVEDFDYLWECLGAQDFLEVVEARSELINLGSQIVEKLILAVPTGNVKQIANAIIVMGKIGDTRFLDSLCALLQHHENIVIRSNAAKILGNFPSEQAIETLIGKLEHDNEMVTMWISVSLGKIGGQEAKHALLKYLNLPPSSTMCYMTIRALGDIGDADLAPIIKPYLTHEKDHVRNDAQLALEKIRSKTQGEHPDV